MHRHVLLLSVLSLPLLLASGGCASVHDLDGSGEDLSAEERDRVDAKVSATLDADDAEDANKWVHAWNQAVDGGLPRERLEEIALDAVGAKKSCGEEMLERLRGKYGSLSPDAREKARALRDEKTEAGDWKQAARIEVLTADDAPLYRGAWQLYDDAPPDKAPAVLEVILEAREQHGRDDG